MRILFSFFIFIFVSSIQVSAQKITVSGRITSTNSRKTLNNVEIYVKNKDKESVKTKEDGFYSIKADKGDTIVFEKGFFKTKQIIVYKSKYNIRLDEDCNPHEMAELIEDLERLLYKLRAENKEIYRRKPCPPCSPCLSEEDAIKKIISESRFDLEKGYIKEVNNKIEITGKIEEKGANTLLKGVTVRVKDGKDRIFTTKDGLYKIRANEGDILIFSKFGYETKEMEVKKDIYNISLGFLMNCDDMDVIIERYNFQINQLRKENELLRRPAPCPPCPPCPSEEEKAK